MFAGERPSVVVGNDEFVGGCWDREHLRLAGIDVDTERCGPFLDGVR